MTYLDFVFFVTFIDVIVKRLRLTKDSIVLVDMFLDRNLLFFTERVILCLLFDPLVKIV